MLTHFIMRLPLLPSPVTGKLYRKPHMSEDKALLALRATQAEHGVLKVSHFKRQKQLGSGDVGLVDLVSLIGTNHEFAMKTLDKQEMIERNKVRTPPKGPRCFGA